jgi:hypothetical protein
MLAHWSLSHEDAAHPHTLIRSHKKQHASIGAVRKFPKSTSSQPICLPASLHFCFLSLPLAPLFCFAQPQHEVLAVARSGERTACRPRRRRRRRVRRSRRRHPSGTARASRTLTRSCSVRSGAASQRYPSATPVSQRACSGCRILAQMHGACHMVPFEAWFLSCYPSLHLRYDAYLCFKCFRHFRCMLQVFHLDVVKSRSGMLHCCICCKCFLEACCKCLFKMFHLSPDVCCNHFFIWMLHMFHTYVATLCSKCFRCFSLMLQHVVSCCNLQFWVHKHVASACSKCFIYFQTYVAFKCFHIAGVLCCWTGGERTGCVVPRGPRGRWCYDRGALGACSSLATHLGSILAMNVLFCCVLPV